MFIAKVVFLGAEAGGRYTPPMSGFHPQVDAGGVYTSCVIENLGTERTFEFDKEYDVAVKLFFPDEYGGNFSVGSVVDFYEGNKHIGYGKIIGMR